MNWESLAPIFGFMLQWARAHTRFPEWAYHVISLLLAGLLIVLTNREFPEDWRDRIGFALMQLWVTVPAIWGGTLAASQMSKVVKGVPATDSR